MAGTADVTGQMSTEAVATRTGVTCNIRDLLDTLQNPQQRDDLKLKALQEINENFENLLVSPQFGQVSESLLKVFVRLLHDTRPQFIGENNTQQLRKLMLEMIHRIPLNESFKAFAKTYTAILFRLIQTENEENVLLCVRILIELHKQFRPPYSQEIENFVQFVKEVYKDLGGKLTRIFEQKPQLSVHDIPDLDIETALQSYFTVTTVNTEQKLADGTNLTYTLLPRGQYSLKVLAELPISIVLFYQIYKQSIHKDIAEFLPLLLGAINMQPPNIECNREAYIDLLSAQIKALSFLAFAIRIYQEQAGMHANLLTQGVLKLLSCCPAEAINLRKELLIAC